MPISLAFLLKAIVSTIIMCCVSYSFFVLGPTAETQWFPVTTDFHIVSISMSDPRQTTIYVTMKKQRDCEYIGLSWFYTDNAGSSRRVYVSLQRKPGDISLPSRPVGNSQGGPWVVDIPADQIIERSYVDVFHRCHPFWLTRSHIYP